MDTETLALLEEIDEIRRLAGMPKLDEVSRRDFMKKAGAGAAAGAAAAAVPGAAQGWTIAKGKSGDTHLWPDDFEEMATTVEDASNAMIGLIMLLNNLEKAGYGKAAEENKKRILTKTTHGSLESIYSALDIMKDLLRGLAK